MSAFRRCQSACAAAPTVSIRAGVGLSAREATPFSYEFYGRFPTNIWAISYNGNGKTRTGIAVTSQYREPHLKCRWMLTTMTTKLPYGADELRRALGREPAPHRADQNGWTDLHYAATLNFAEMARTLLAGGAAVDAPLKDDIEQLDGEPLTVLRQCGRTFKTWEREGDTPLHLAAWSDAAATAETLIEFGADPHARLTSGCTPLHVAARFDAIGAATALIANGAEVNDRDKRGWTPLHAAVRCDAFAIAELLLSRGTEVNAKAERGLTPLHFAIIGDAPNVRDTPRFARLLLEHGAQVNAVTTDDLRVTPLDIADSLNLPITSALLRRYGGDVTLEERNEVVGMMHRRVGRHGDAFMPIVRRSTRRRQPRDQHLRR